MKLKSTLNRASLLALIYLPLTPTPCIAEIITLYCNVQSSGKIKAETYKVDTKKNTITDGAIDGIEASISETRISWSFPNGVFNKIIDRIDGTIQVTAVDPILAGKIIRQGDCKKSAERKF